LPPEFQASRGEILRQLQEELVGPAPTGTALETALPVSFDTKESAYGPFTTQDGEEVLQRVRPLKRYGVGVLYPRGTAGGDAVQEDPATGNGGDLDQVGEALEDELADQELGVDDPLAATAIKDLNQLSARAANGGRTRDDGDEFDLSAANDYRPSAMAITFLAHLPPGADLEIEADGGRYLPLEVAVQGKHRKWWRRSPVKLNAIFTGASLRVLTRQLVAPSAMSQIGTDGMGISITAFSRPYENEHALITVALTNQEVGGKDEACLFQSRFRASLTGPGRVLPYPKRSGSDGSGNDREEAGFDLLYRKHRTFAVGHGCSADWEATDGGTTGWIAAEPFPAVETPSITPVITLADGKGLTVPMAALAGLNPASDGFDQLELVANEYDAWITARRDEMMGIEPAFHRAAVDHLNRCTVTLGRIRDGIVLLREDPQVARAFQLANHAILLQQLRSRPTAREVQMDARSGRFLITESSEIPSWQTATERGNWRPFQIAFVLAALRSVADGEHPERQTVELVFAPTGAGKTEAYLGLAALALFLRRLRNPNDDGVEVLMRYTLRLLTTQQFQRAAALTCAMEHLRRNSHDLGTSPFSIGIWVGNAATPGQRAEARSILKKLNAGEQWAENLFVLLRCPWCSAQFGPVAVLGKATRSTLRVAGYVEAGGTVVFECPDPSCEFAAGLPVFVIDEDIYVQRPSMIIGTVDKFAMLAWNPAARAIFGIGPDGARESSPPGTIIQDELHLISGPLGSMVGLYETVIEELCTDHSGPEPIHPKIVSSTATIRRYSEQVHDLYARNDVALFPPHGIDVSDSFFTKYAREPDGSLSPGRLYVGVHAGGLGSVQTAQVRTLAALLQAPLELDNDERDPWWTLMCFFNSLRELGTSLSLLQSDIPDYLGSLRNRMGLDPRNVRRLRNVRELTSRLRNDEVPMAIEQLSVPASAGSAVDVCLASSMIEVGIDIERLSLMAVFGQPKSTSQYIQVTGRVGRRWWERPGLVVTIFGPSKPRDRSHYEKFRSYHERLYAQVEPTSVTPFSPPVLDRALHAVLCAYVRQLGPVGLRPWPLPDSLVAGAVDLLVSRAEATDPEEASNLKEVLTRRINEWQYWERTSWQAMSGGQNQYPLLRRSGEWVPPEAAAVSWATPTSMRDVDADCLAEVTIRYALERGESVGD